MVILSRIILSPLNISNSLFDKKIYFKKSKN